MNIKEKRKEKGISLNQLAEKTGINKGNLSKIENGHTNITIKTLKKIAKALDSKLIIKLI
jgi:transcriptional regulator with XRE-family HTH domain